MLIAAEKGARLIVSVGSQFNLVEFLDRNRKGMSSTFLTRLRIGEILVDAKGVSRLYRPRPGLTPLLVVIAAGLIAMIAVVWMTPALRDVAELLWLKLQLLAGIGRLTRAPADRRRSIRCSTTATTRSRSPRSCSRSRSASLLGVAIGDSNLVSSAKNGIVANLNSEVGHARQQASQLQEQLPARGSVRQRPVSAGRARTARRAHDRAGVPRRLLRTVNALVRTAVAQAGGDVTTVVAVREPLDLAGARPARPRGHPLRGARRLDAASSNASATLVGRQLVSGGTLVDRELISRVRASLLSAFDGQLTRLEGLVVMRAEPTRHERRAERSQRGVRVGPARRRRRRGVPAVGVELSGTEPSQIPWYKRQGLSSVDDLDKPRRPGRARLRARRRPRRVRHQVDRRLAAAERRPSPAQPRPAEPWRVRPRR